MNIKKNLLFNLIGWSILAAFIYWKNQESTEKSRAIIIQVFEKEFNCIVKQKIKDEKNHGFSTLVLLDIKNSENFDFDPSDVSHGLILFRKVNVGDTLTKGAQSNIFFIMNKEKRDSVIFEFNIK